MDLFADQVINNTQFTYLPENNPRIFRGTIGRLFGHLGHFSASYIDTVRKALRNAPLDQKLAIVARGAMITATAKMAAEEVMGIRSDSFTPIGMATFSGGPLYETMNQAIKLYGGADYERNIALENLARSLNTFVPGGLVMEDVAEAYELFQQGKVYKGYLTLLSFPMTDDPRRFYPSEMATPEFLPDLED